MALFTARPRRAGTKGATPAAVQYIPHAEQGLVPEPWAKSTVPLALSDGGEKEEDGWREGGGDRLTAYDFCCLTLVLLWARLTPQIIDAFDVAHFEVAN